MRFPEDQERSKTLETSPPFLTFGSLTVPYFLSYSLIILSKARFIKSLIAIPSLAAIVLIFVTLSSSAIVQNLITLLCKAGRPLLVLFCSSAAESSFTGADEANMKRAMLLIFVFLHLADLPCFSSGFLPTGEELVHQCMETGIVTGFQQMAQLMNHHVLNTPFR